MRRELIIATALFSLTSVVGAEDGNEQADALLDQARATWARNGLTDYSYTLERGGAFGAGPKLRIRVEAGKCVQVTYWQTFLRREDTCDNRTVPELFDELDRAIQSRPVRVELKFDQEFGYPIEVSVEPRTDLSDQQWWYSISRFRH